ncbi:PREDICTED: small nuclear ribonucleoprotein Sm D2-like [Elephantulus edwardii]|uniref:small nuclear ribonucleoprotein Sm D2-like n=1 Tax=Elephantulus edwardii TaxID=28737 RepID=UPI0003F0819C|nr:PREDICTED: small nuclear ribonucleoprotein Sm D2-like [Elephantulus edwardii]
MSLLNKPRSEMTSEEGQKREEEEFNTGQLSALTQWVKNNTQVLINCCNVKLLDREKAFDKHCNVVLENVEGMWTEVLKRGKDKKKSKPINNDRYISKMSLRGDSVIVGLRIPLISSKSGCSHLYNPAPQPPPASCHPWMTCLELGRIKSLVKQEKARCSLCARHFSRYQKDKDEGETPSPKG